MHTHGHHRLHEFLRRKAEEMPAIANDAATASLNKRASTTTVALTATCTAGDPSPRCELPANATNQTLPILLGAMVPIFIACLVLVYLHRRHTQKLRKEDAMDKTKSMDFGMEFGSSGSGGKRSKIPPAHLADGEKSASRSRRQVSLDLDVASPYLLPAGLHNSHDTLQTMGASVDDRYGRPMTAGRDSSIYAHSIPQDDSPDGSRTSMNRGLLSGASPMSMSTPPHPGKPSMPNPSHNIPQISIPSPAAMKSPGLPLSPHARVKAPESIVQDASPKKIKVQQPVPQQPTNGLPPALIIGSSQQSPQIDIQFDSAEASRPFSNDQSEYGDGPQLRLSMASVRSETENPYPQAHGRKSLAPGAFEDRRLSIGFRPLPPEGLADENAEERAMRIRSFYKEYFEDTSPAPPMPTQSRVNRQDEHNGEYHDDSVAVYDQETGRFVIPGARPFAEAPTRRAMTPPPRMPPRFGGPPPRNGSAASGQFIPPGPRSFSSASGRAGAGGPPPQRKPTAPPAPLHLLPTPSMLKEDAFSSPVIFAPSSRIQGDGSDSPSLRGGLRPYSPSVSPHVPLASAFDELSLLPNPHSLRNSSTFTGLDFAPPRKFKNDDAISDAGSIRSNNSGVTAQQIQNIRNGAYRVSRIPQDVVPAKEAITSNLKPTWDMRK